ncbi:hypothetical protein C0Q70_19744 [Pomacea canaliculata]|uniref:Fibrinogen C-terminal domain-containing protein n=1 Tax=Pomacea canaliculata TaxID=400727 RepID=A0A2T7NDK9_POMCA|nr:hypothetical protein C0Q70_19744 [Pomacea canaliculata]
MSDTTDDKRKETVVTFKAVMTQNLHDVMPIVQVDCNPPRPLLCICVQTQVELKNGSKLYVIYNNFVVKGEDSLYQFHFDSLNSVLNPTGDCLSDLRGANFSTYDNDNDGDSSVNCASRHSGGGGGTI